MSGRLAKVRLDNAVVAAPVQGVREGFSRFMDVANAGAREAQRGYRTAASFVDTNTDIHTTRQSADPANPFNNAIPHFGMADPTDHQKVQAAREQEAGYYFQQAVKAGKIPLAQQTKIEKGGPRAALDWYQNLNDPDTAKGMDALRAYSGSWGDAGMASECKKD